MAKNMCSLILKSIFFKRNCNKYVLDHLMNIIYHSFYCGKRTIYDMLKGNKCREPHKCVTMKRTVWRKRGHKSQHTCCHFLRTPSLENFLILSYMFKFHHTIQWINFSMSIFSFWNESSNFQQRATCSFIIKIWRKIWII